MEIKKLASLIESLLFAAGDLLTINRISQITGADLKTVKEAVQLLSDELEHSKRGVRVRRIENGYQMHTAPENNAYVEMLHEIRTKQGLSQSAMEVLSIIAYRQPVTRIQIEKIRGASSDNALSRLLERGLVRVAGRLDAPGRPILYETTQNFLRAFGFSSLNELPVLDIPDASKSNENESIPKSDG